ncbi:response regulator [Thermodesulfobacteriota bacterium]
MGKINEQDLLDEIRFDIKVNDPLKAKLVLSSLERVSRETQKQALFEVSRADDDFSIPLLAGVISNSPNISESFPQLRETMFSKVLDNPEILLDLLSKGGDSVRRAFLAEVAGEIRFEKAVPVLLDILTEEKDLKVIESVIISLGMIGDAAAKAIDRNYNPVLAGGVRNLTRSEGTQALTIMATIINSQCENIFLDLLEEDYFQDPAVKYLANRAHPDIRSHFVRILTEKGYNDLALKITSEKLTEGKVKLKVFAVDDSKMVLNIYRTVLYNLGCESQLFEFPAMALKRVRKEKPDVILTDLNMPNITGIDFTRGVRIKYSKEELPIIMITTQDEVQDHKAAYGAGVNGILQKPFTEGQLGKALKEFTGMRFST